MKVSEGINLTDNMENYASVNMVTYLTVNYLVYSWINCSRLEQCDSTISLKFLLAVSRSLMKLRAE